MSQQRFPTLAEESLDQVLDALVLGEPVLPERLAEVDPDLWASVEELYILANLSGFADDQVDWAGSDRETEVTSAPAIATDRTGQTSPLPGIIPLGPRGGRRLARLTSLSVAAGLLIAIIGTTALLAMRGDNRRDPEPVLLEAASSVTPTGSTRDLVDLPASTQPLAVANPETLGYGGMAVAGSSIVRLLATPEFTGVEGIDVESETVVWRLETPWSSAGISGGASGVYFVADPNLLVSVDPATGVDLWQRSFGGPVVSMALQNADLNDDVLYVWDESSTMTAIDTTTGDPIWDTMTADPGGPQATTGQTTPGIAPAIGEDVVVMVAANGTLNAFDRTTGQISWSAPGFDGIDTRMAINFDYLMVLSASGVPNGPTNLIGTGVDLRTGETKWQLGVSGLLLRPAASEETFFYFVADTVENVQDGVEIPPVRVNYAECCASWPETRESDAESAGGPNGGSHIFGVDTATGTVIWSRSTNAGDFITVKTSIPPQSGGLFAVTSDGRIVWLQRETGGILETPAELGGRIVDIIPLQNDYVRYAMLLADGSLVTIRMTQPPG